MFFKTLLFDKFEGFNNTILYSSSPVILVILNKPGFILWLLTSMVLVPSFYGGIWCPNHVL